MKSIPKLIRRFVGIGVLSAVGLLLLNLLLLALITGKMSSNLQPWMTAEETLNHLRQTENGYVLDEEMKKELKKQGVWGIFLDNDTRKAVWSTENLPENIPRSFTLSETVWACRGYIQDYPTFTAGNEKGVVVLGYPKDSFWKHMWPNWDLSFIKNAPKLALLVLGCNVAVIFLIYVVSNAGSVKSVRPIIKGIQDLPTGERVHVREAGLLSEIAEKINRTSEILQSQKYQLQKKETARANWIAGVSHDIRTPLSMVMGYAGQLEQSPSMTEENRGKAVVILKQSQRIRDLINDLNLASRLEYNMQPLRKERFPVTALVRQTAVDFMNLDITGKYPIEWKSEERGESAFVNGDRELLRRAVSNLIQNCINHNENGCRIYLSSETEADAYIIKVEDDGQGALEEEIERLNNTPHYMVCDREITEQRHGLGLLLVKQIAEAHGGTMFVGKSEFGGFLALISLPAEFCRAERRDE